MSEKMASRQYFKGFALLAMLMTNPGLTWGQESTTPTPEESTTPMPAGEYHPNARSECRPNVPRYRHERGYHDSGIHTADRDSAPLQHCTVGLDDGGYHRQPAAMANANYSVPQRHDKHDLSTELGFVCPVHPHPKQISCRQFTCNESQCYSIFINQTAMPCNANFSYCQLQRVAYMSYTVGCSANCTTTPCTNQTQTGCSVGCCNTTDCLNVTMSTMVPTTAAPTTTKTTTKAPTTTTQGSNGKKCNQLTCTGETCYTQASQKTLVVACLGGQDYCQLKKTVAGAVMTWKAGCSGDCRKDTPCSSTAVDCTQECCNATLASSCLKLDGTLNIPGSASSPALGPAPCCWPPPCWPGCSRRSSTFSNRGN
ncbi:hypothetical protein ANANG_G00025770 [Anguilla anguilla]|uniref:Uncharacterized protein n=1 Tax=Anguilla anguilla TaxID=7936 RepID=A0A9D3S716_ANGAN|nr:hypothetical protein ANANG_G00025770 [Anguilla anguilla]